MTPMQTNSNDILSQSLYLTSTREWSTGLGASEFQEIAQRALMLLDDYYAHLPLKRSSLGIDPVQEIRLLADDVRFIPSESQFNRRLLEIFKRLRDRHTAVYLPSPWRDMVAFLPFAVESYFDERGRHLIVSKILGDVGDPAFKVGSEITHWNGIEIARYIEAFSWNNDGANPFARIALALRSLTVRSLGFVQSPDEDWVNLTYQSSTGYRTVVVPWRVYIPQALSAAGVASASPSGGLAALEGVDRNSLVVNGAWQDLFSTPSPSSLVAAAQGTALQNLWARSVQTSSGEWGYIRIFSFDSADPAAFVTQFAELLRVLPNRGLILDLRSNPGGTIPAGESLLALFTQTPTFPQPVSFRITAATRDLARAQILKPWLRSLKISLETGEIFSQGFSVTEQNLGPTGVYSGPVVLIIDALCYSTTDFFAAGMQDHGLATIIGVDPVTGAGGANVWSQSTLSYLISDGGGQGFNALPGGYDLNIAIRRSLRVGPNAGLPVEGLGVFADLGYNMTLRDVTSSNEDLIEFAGQVLASKSPR